jgi:hypothetical protein
MIKKLHIRFLGRIAMLLFLVFLCTGCAAFLRSSPDNHVDDRIGEPAVLLEGPEGILEEDKQENKRVPANPQEAGKDGQDKKSIVFTISYDFAITGHTEKIVFTTLIPSDYEKRQEVLGIEYSIEPDEIFTDADGLNEYATFVFEKPSKDFRLDIVSMMHIFAYDLQEAMQSSAKQDHDDEDLQAYLIEEEFISVYDPYLRDVEVFGTLGEDPVENVKKLYTYVLENMQYLGYNPDPISGIEALKNKGGDCTEYSDALITLCRAAGIPARFAEGYVMGNKDISIGHNWVEIYLDDYGWVPFDPTFDDTSLDPKRFGFGDLENVYVYMSLIRNDENLANYHFYVYYYWGDHFTVNKHITIETQ